ncbi:hypothetical protein WDU94_011940 [Cyamophila willieti]
MERKLMDYFDNKFGILEETIAKQKNEVIQAMSNQVAQLEKKLVERDHKILELEEKVDMLGKKKYKDFKRKEGGAFSAKKINGNLPDAKVFIHEHITVSKKLLLNEVRAFAREKNIQFVWVKDAMILVKKSEADRQVTKISSNESLKRSKRK